MGSHSIIHAFTLYFDGLSSTIGLSVIPFEKQKREKEEEKKTDCIYGWIRCAHLLFIFSNYDLEFAIRVCVCVWIWSPFTIYSYVRFTQYATKAHLSFIGQDKGISKRE